MSRVYWPTGSTGNVYDPLASVCACAEKPVFVSRRLTRACGTRLPDESLTIPEILPPTLAQATTELNSPATHCAANIAARKPILTSLALIYRPRKKHSFTLRPAMKKRGLSGQLKLRGQEPYSEGSPQSIRLWSPRSLRSPPRDFREDLVLICYCTCFFFFATQALQSPPTSRRITWISKSFSLAISRLRRSKVGVSNSSTVPHPRHAK